MIAQQRKQLIYQPLVFVLTQTIGGNKTVLSALKFQQNHQHIVVPKYLNNPNIGWYIMFHNPYIYNWMRSITSKESLLLNEYISSNGNNINKIQQQVDSKKIIKLLQQYSKRWDVVRYALNSQIYVSKAKNMPCNHLPKTTIKVLQHEYDQINKQFINKKVYCKDCQHNIQIQGQIRNYAPYIVSKYTRQKVNNNNHSYQLVVLFTNYQIFIKAANKIWYKIDLKNGKSTTVGFNQIFTKEGKLGVYCKQFLTSNNLILAPPLKQNQIIQQKKINKKVTQNHTSKQNISYNYTNKYVQKQSQKIKEEIKQLKKQINKIDVIGPNTDQYRKQVSQLYINQKQKDQYQKDYDKGKLKKKKQIKNYPVLNFNQLYDKVKSSQNNSQIIKQGKKINKKRKNRNKQTK